MITKMFLCNWTPAEARGMLDSIERSTRWLFLYFCGSLDLEKGYLKKKWYYDSIVKRLKWKNPWKWFDLTFLSFHFRGYLLSQVNSQNPHFKGIDKQVFKGQWYIKKLKYPMWSIQQ